MTDQELAAAMKAKGMLPLDEILAGNLMGKFSTHCAALIVSWFPENSKEGSA